MEIHGFTDTQILKYKFIAVTDKGRNYRGLAVIRKEHILDDAVCLGRILEFISLDAEASITLANTVIESYQDITAWDFYCLSDVTAYGLEMVGFRKILSWMQYVMLPTRFQPMIFQTIALW